ncbi:hypothetical protein [Haloferula sp. A504]|uniref:hypothetical protein n=1 Tax=Haloferula sp. A504 TaxID=3373601 RepID=UPI0031C7CAD2|nr:hypothetical protein [Verrucomicrobiaceae bacterium E54]
MGRGVAEDKVKGSPSWLGITAVQIREELQQLKTPRWDGRSIRSGRYHDVATNFSIRVLAGVGQMVLSFGKIPIVLACMFVIPYDAALPSFPRGLPWINPPPARFPLPTMPTESIFHEIPTSPIDGTSRSDRSGFRCDDREN